MKNTILWSLVLLAPLLWTTTAHALFGVPDFAALAQRVTIIANQGVQIAHSVTQISKITEQMTEIKNQYAHLKNEALGHVGALTDPFVTLAAVPGRYVKDGLAWRTDYTGTTTAGLIDAFELFSDTGTPMTDYWRTRLDAAPDTTEAEVLAEYNTMPLSLADRAAANYRRQRDHGQQQTAQSQIVNTAASDATATVRSARDSFALLRGQTNQSGTALQQAQITGTITAGEVSAAFLQLHAHEAARLDRNRVARATHARHRAGIEASRDGGDSLLFSLVQQ